MDWIESKEQKPDTGQQVWVKFLGKEISGIAIVRHNRFTVICGNITVLNPEVWATYETVY